MFITSAESQHFWVALCSIYDLRPKVCRSGFKRQTLLSVYDRSSRHHLNRRMLCAIDLEFLVVVVLVGLLVLGGSISTLCTTQGYKKPRLTVWFLELCVFHRLLQPLTKLALTIGFEKAPRQNVHVGSVAGVVVMRKREVQNVYGYKKLLPGSLQTASVLGNRKYLFLPIPKEAFEDLCAVLHLRGLTDL